MNSSAVSFFFDVSTQWRCVARGMAGALEWLGIDYAAAVALLSTRSRSQCRRAPAARLMSDLRVMEAEARPIMNEDRE